MVIAATSHNKNRARPTLRGPPRTRCSRRSVSRPRPAVRTASLSVSNAPGPGPTEALSTAYPSFPRGPGRCLWEAAVGTTPGPAGTRRGRSRDRSGPKWWRRVARGCGHVPRAHRSGPSARAAGTSVRVAFSAAGSGAPGRPLQGCRAGAGFVGTHPSGAGCGAAARRPPGRPPKFSHSASPPALQAALGSTDAASRAVAQEVGLSAPSPSRRRPTGRPAKVPEVTGAGQGPPAACAFVAPASPPPRAARAPAAAAPHGRGPRPTPRWRRRRAETPLASGARGGAARPRPTLTRHSPLRLARRAWKPLSPGSQSPQAAAGSSVAAAEATAALLPAPPRRQRAPAHSAPSRLLTGRTIEAPGGARGWGGDHREGRPAAAPSRSPPTESRLPL